MISHLVASMRGEDGRVRIHGFYDDVQPLTEMEKRAIAATPVVEDALRAELGLHRTENGSRPLSDIINEPTLNVRGLRSVDVGKQARNVVPASATASIDLRLVKGLDPDRATARVTDHVRKQGYFVTEREPDDTMRKAHARIARVFRPKPGYPAAKTPMDLPVARWLVNAVQQVSGPVVEAPTLGGSVPLYVFEQELRTPFVGLPIANYDSNQHSSDENLRLDHLWKGIDLMAAVMSAP
jgi:acetylornithine deacetylase/succinyl-diaminopimelate desuccinylase-like protein